VATFIPLVDTAHWRNGVQVWGYPPDVPLTFNPCSTGTDRIKAEGGVIPIGEFGAYTVYVAETCTARSIGGNDMQAAFRARALATLQATESYAVELEFGSGVAFPLNPHLTDVNLDILGSGAALSPVIAIGLLENAIAATGRTGVIHVDPATAEALAASHLIFESGTPGGPSAQLWTYRGTRIVVGDGYVGLIPESEGTILVDSTAWMFATGPVVFERSEPFYIPDDVSQALDRENNTITYRVERDFVAAWDTELQAGVLVDLEQASGDLPAGAATAANQALEIAQLTAINSSLDGPLLAAPVTGVVYDQAGVALTPKFAFANVAASATDSALVAAVALKKIRVLALYAIAGGTQTNLTFNSKPGGAGTAISPLLANAQNGGEVLGFNPSGWFETTAGQGLSVTTGTGSATGIGVVYVEA
jgi:hypothetical protein